MIQVNAKYRLIPTVKAAAFYHLIEKVIELLNLQKRKINRAPLPPNITTINNKYKNKLVSFTWVYNISAT